MSTFYTVKEQLQELIDFANSKTNNSDNDLTNAITNLASRYCVDGSNVAFGYENGEPVSRDEQYGISSEDLNELGKIVQGVANTKSLLTLDDMIYWLTRARFIPQGYANTTVEANSTRYTVTINE